MRFVKYKLIMRPDGSFITPDGAADPVKAQFKTIYGPIDISSWHIGTLADGFTLFPYAQYQMEDVTTGQALEIIQQDDPDATLSDDGELSIPNLRFDTPPESE